MEWKDVISMVGVYVLTLIFLAGAHGFAYCMDDGLYEANKYNLDRKTMKVGLRWFFWRCKKDDRKEIFIVTFIHEVVTAIFFIAITAMLAVTLLLNEEFIMLISFCSIFIYFIYCLVIEKLIQRKYKKQN